MWWPWRKYRIVKCPDGERIVYIDPNDVFPLSLGVWSTKFKGAVSAAKEFQGELDADLKNEAQAFLVQLDKANISMQSQFRAVYAVYQTNPCNRDDYLAEGIKNIIDGENTLRKVLLEITRIESLKRQGIDKNTIREAIEESKRKISRSDFEEDISKEFQKVEKNILAWEED